MTEDDAGMRGVRGGQAKKIGVVGDDYATLRLGILKMCFVAGGS